MNPQLRTLFTLFICLPFLWQCVASEQDMKSMNLRYYSLKSRVDALESSSQKQYARLASDLDRLRGEFMQVKAAFEEESHMAQQLQADKKASTSRLNRRLQDLDIEYQGAIAEVRKEMNRNVSILQNEVDSIKKARLQDASLKAQKAAMAAEEARKKARAAEMERQKAKKANKPKEIAPRSKKRKLSAAKSSPVPKKTDTATSGTPPLYRQGLEQFRNKEFDKAFFSFSTYLEKNPGSPLEADVRFLVGETLFEQHKYDIAILEYQKIIDNFPYHDKAAASLMKQAMSFENNNDSMTAKILFERLIQVYPKSPYAKDAKKRLQSLK